MKKTTLIILLCAVLFLSACNTTPNNDDNPINHDSIIEETTANSCSPDTVMPNTYTLPEDFVYPITDGSTSTINLDNAVKSAILGGEQLSSHSKTYTAFYNLLEGKCELIFTTPLSAEQLRIMERDVFFHEAEPVAGEGFVFVVNKDNPVDTLTVEQLKRIYSGEITNWKDVGGNDAEIIAYQRNADSGSQNYMLSFMGDTKLMKPITDEIPATMSGILDVIANYDNGIDAIGYSVYAYSDGMYENISKIKYIKVNGVEPSLTTLADGSYPLLGYNYAVFSADEPDDSNVRALVKWIQSDEGQQVIADAGYIPYRKVDGLTLPESTGKTLYTSLGTSGIAKPETVADCYYQCKAWSSNSFTIEGLDQQIEDFITKATDELSKIDKDKMQEFLDSRSAYCDTTILTEKKILNGYLSVAVGLRYSFGVQDSPFYYYDVRTAVFDIYTGKQLELSDLFFEGDDFVPLLNKHLASEAEMPYSSWGSTHDMLSDFKGLYDGNFAFTIDSIIFKPGTCFADGVELSLYGIYKHMVTSVPRDMAGPIDEETPVYKCLDIYSSSDIGYGEEIDRMGIWYLDKDKTSISDEVCDKINSFVKNTYEDHFTNEKLAELLNNAGIIYESMEVGPFPNFYLSVHGNRYIEFDGTNTLIYNNNDEYGELPILDGHYRRFNFTFYFNTETGEELIIDDLFEEGWQNSAQYCVIDENFNYWNESTFTEYTKEIDPKKCRILNIENYDEPPFNKGDLSDLSWPAFICLMTDSDEMVAVLVPREYIK